MYCEAVICLIHRLAEATGRSPRTVSTYAAGSGDFCDRLERGADLTTRRGARVVQWLSDHWPDDLDWPADIPRPAPRREGKAA